MVQLISNEIRQAWKILRDVSQKFSFSTNLAEITWQAKEKKGFGYV